MSNAFIKHVQTSDQNIESVPVTDGQLLLSSDSDKFFFDAGLNRYEAGRQKWEVYEAGPKWDDRGLEYNSWDTIAWYIRHGQTEGKFAVGDTKTFVTSNNKTVAMQLVSINDGIGEAGSYYPEGTADFVSVDIYGPQKFKDGETGGGWRDSALRALLNGTIYNTLPSDVKGVIVPKTHQYTVDGTDAFVEVTDNIWVPTAWEAIGANSDGQYLNTYETSANNKHYSVFNSNNARRKRRDGTYYFWWLATNYRGHVPYYIQLTNKQGIMSYSGQNASYSINDYNYTICFRIG